MFSVSVSLHLRTKDIWFLPQKKLILSANPLEKINEYPTKQK